MKPLAYIALNGEVIGNVSSCPCTQLAPPSPTIVPIKMWGSFSDFYIIAAMILMWCKWNTVMLFLKNAIHCKI